MEIIKVSLKCQLFPYDSYLAIFPKKLGIVIKKCAVKNAEKLEAL